MAAAAPWVTPRSISTWMTGSLIAASTADSDMCMRPQLTRTSIDPSWSLSSIFILLYFSPYINYLTIHIFYKNENG